MQINAAFPWRLIGIRPTGDVGPFTLYTNRKGKLICFLKTRPAKPLTARQRANMRKFEAIASVWRSMEPAQRADWSLAAKRAGLTITAYNLFIYSQMQPDSSTLLTVQNQSGICLGFGLK
jgi:hypothetical protein